MDPLKLTILKYGTIGLYEEKAGYKLPQINPGNVDMKALLRQERGKATPKGVPYR